MALRVSGSVTTTHCQPWWLDPVGAWRARARHSSSTSRSTGREKSRRRRTDRVVLSSSSGVRSRTTAGDVTPTPDHAGLARVGTRALREDRVPQRCTILPQPVDVTPPRQDPGVDAERQLVRWAHRQHGLVTRAQALAAGLSSRQVLGRLDSGRWQAVRRGVYAGGWVPPSWEQAVL